MRGAAKKWKWFVGFGTGAAVVAGKCRLEVFVSLRSGAQPGHVLASYSFVSRDCFDASKSLFVRQVAHSPR